MNLTKNDSSIVDIEGKWYKDQLFITLTRNDHDTGISTFNFAVDDTDLEHFISTLIEFQR
jgi:hypothetical protein